jgi:CheY-like chemotaxis protein
MFQHSYPVLLVDDDPDVLSVSKLALRSITVFGVPLNVSAASSKKEAIELLGRRTTKLPGGRGIAPFAVALIDVVMETNTAGLELCQHIRDNMKDKITQIYIRTGQAGLAPERSVIDRYDINGYFTKVELTEQKLYTLVKAGVREVHNTIRHYVVAEVIDALIANAGSTERMSAVFGQTLHALREGADGRPTNDVDPRAAVIIDGKVVANGMDQGDEALLGRSRDLAALPGTPVGPNGDRYVVDKGCFQVAVAKSPSTVEARFLAMTPGEPAEFMAEPYHRMMHAAALLWKQARAS